MTTVEVSLGSRSYSIKLEAALITKTGELIAKQFSSKKVVILSSSDISQLHGKTILSSLQAAGLEGTIINLANGELAKNLNEIGRALSELAKLNLDRNSLIIALGGGAIGDSASLIASLYMRGIRYVQIPTTLLAMVDSSIGGKTAINLPEGKNLVGTFHQPSMVIIDPTVLSSLPLRELQAGVAEIIKYGIIADSDLFNTLSQGFPNNWIPIIKRCCEIKARIVEQDEFEQKDIRALLNFGHTIGHAIEAAAGYGGFLHGEAISIGMVGAAYLSVKYAGLSTKDAKIITETLEHHKLPTSWPEMDPDKVWQILARDKKFKNGNIRFVLTSHIGQALVSDKITAQDIQEALQICRG